VAETPERFGLSADVVGLVDDRFALRGAACDDAMSVATVF